MIQVNFKMDEIDHRDLGIAAKEEDLTVSQVLRKLASEYLFHREIAKKKKRDKR